MSDLYPTWYPHDVPRSALLFQWAYLYEDPTWRFKVWDDDFKLLALHWRQLVEALTAPLRGWLFL